MVSILMVITVISFRLLYCPQAVVGLHSVDHATEIRHTLKHPDLRGCPTVSGTTGQGVKLPRNLPNFPPHEHSLHCKVEVNYFVDASLRFPSYSIILPIIS